MKKLLVLLALACLFTAGCAAEQTAFYRLGDTMEDFTVVTDSGESVTLYGLLEEKDVVLINLWATWCGACCNEFPAIEEAYLARQDQAEVLALSTEPGDTPDVLREFAQTENLSFLFAQDTPDLYGRFALEAIPASIVVDRYGVICFVGTVLPETDSFLRLLDAFLGDEYDESLILTDVPPEKPSVAASAEADIAAALGTAAANPTDDYTWPMPVAEKDGRSVVASSNAGVGLSAASVTAKIDAKAGDAVAVTFKTSTETSADTLSIQLNGEQIKLFSGEHDWMTYAFPVENDGSHDVTLSYVKDPLFDAGEDTVWIDSVTVLSGQAAADALAANPVYPTGDTTAISLINCQPREVVFRDEGDVLAYAFPDTKYYMVDTDTVTFRATLAADVDPEGAFFSHLFDGSFFGLTDCMTEDGYMIEREVASVPESVIPFTAVMLGLDPYGSESKTALAFRSEENIDSFLSAFGLHEWAYADEQGAAEMANHPFAPTKADYTIRCVDQNGDPVADVKVQICDEASCRVVNTDADGVYVLTTEPCAWEIHVLIAPTGYTADSGETLIAPVNGGEITLTLNKD